jgi:hypothetical protein
MSSAPRREPIRRTEDGGADAPPSKSPSLHEMLGCLRGLTEDEAAGWLPLHWPGRDAERPAKSILLDCKFPSALFVAFSRRCDNIHFSSLDRFK